MIKHSENFLEFEAILFQTKTSSCIILSRNSEDKLMIPIPVSIIKLGLLKPQLGKERVNPLWNIYILAVKYIILIYFVILFPS